MSDVYNLPEPRFQCNDGSIMAALSAKIAAQRIMQEQILYTHTNL